MMIYEIIPRMHGARNENEYQKNLRFLKTITERLSRAGPVDSDPFVGPFIVRIITTSKYFTGQLEELKLINNHQFRFRIRDCHQNGSSNGTAVVFEETADLKDLKDVSVLRDSKNRSVFWSDLFPDLPNNINGDLK